MKVLIIAGHSESLINFRKELLLEFVRKGHDVHAAAPNLDERSQVAKALTALRIKPVDISLTRVGMNPFADLICLWRLYQLMRNLEPSLVLGYTIKPVIWGSLAAALAGTEHRFALITGLGHAFAENKSAKQRLLRLIVEKLYRSALRQTHLVIFQNPDDEAFFKNTQILSAKSRTKVVSGSGVDLEHYVRCDLPIGMVSFVLVARMLAAKGIREFAAAAKQVRAMHPQAQFHLVGDVDTSPDSLEVTEIESWVKAGDVIWHGAVDDVRPYIARAHVCVLPSYYPEGTPRSLLEAMAMGRALITTDSPGCRETIDQGRNGILVPARNSKELANAMLRLIEAPDLLREMADASHQFARDRFDVRKVNAEMFEAMGI